MATPQWQPGTLYPPGSIVRRVSSPSPTVFPPENANFEAGNVDWTLGTNWAIVQNDEPFQGSWCARKNGPASTSEIMNQGDFPVVAGQSITASCQVQQGPSSAGQTSGCVILRWYDAVDGVIRTDEGNRVDSASGGAYKLSTVTGVAPSNAVRVGIGATSTSTVTTETRFDAFQWNYATTAVTDSLVFQAVQANAGYSGSTEPVWPATAGLQVIDNEVTWEAIDTSRVVWEASPILVSGAVEPTWPTEVGETIADNTIVWTAVSRQITDPKCPQSKYVAIAASKVFAADDDIIPFCSTNNPLDWSTADDAGYLPFGLQTYGANPVTALGLYRGNLMAFNAAGFQMWQVDQDPANMALLDAVPIGSRYHLALAPVSNDLVMLTDLGVRNVGIAGASTNLQAGDFGKAIDPLIINELRTSGFTPFAIFNPSLGQYMEFFGPMCYVMTINGKEMSWSRWEFPEEVTDVTIHNGAIMLRTVNDRVWEMSDQALQDDIFVTGDAVVLDAELTGPDDITVTWTEADTTGAPDGVQYRLWSSLNSGPFSLLATIPFGDPRQHVDEDVPLGSHSYYVDYVDEGGEASPASNIDTVDTVTPTDPDFEDVVVLLQAHTGTLVEASGLPTVTVAGAGAVSAAEAKFGVASFRNPGTNAEGTNYVRLEDTTNGQGLFVFPGEVTIEGWFYLVSYNTASYANLFANAVNFPLNGFIQMTVATAAGNFLFWNSAPGTPGAIGSEIVPLNQWVHLAATRNASGVLTLWQDGQPVATHAIVGGLGILNPFKSSLDVCRGHAADNSDANCYFDQIRMTKKCRYTVPFTPPTAPFPSVG